MKKVLCKREFCASLWPPVVFQNQSEDYHTKGGEKLIGFDRQGSKKRAQNCVKLNTKDRDEYGDLRLRFDAYVAEI